MDGSAMADPLAGARLKIIRAEQHLRSLHDEIGAYLQTDPYKFPVEFDDDAGIMEPAVITHDPPLELGCIVGDCLGNLRASLDYIAWQLASKYSATPLV